MNDDNFILIPCDIIKNKKLDIYAFAIYVYLTMCRNAYLPDNKDLHYFCMNSFIYYFNQSMSYKNKARIKQGLDSLVDNNIITYKNGLNVNEYLINYIDSKFVIKKNSFFVKLDINQFNKIMYIKSISDLKKLKLLRYYCGLVNTYNNKIQKSEKADNQAFNNETDKYENRIVGTCSLKYISAITGVTQPTAIEYNKILEDNQIIYVYHSKIGFYDEGKMQMQNNIYGDYRQRDFINNFVKYMETKQKGTIVQINTDESCNKKSLSLKYRHFMNGSKYSLPELRSILQYVQEDNEKRKQLYEEYHDDNILKGIRETTKLEQEIALKNKNKGRN